MKPGLKDRKIYYRGDVINVLIMFLHILLIFEDPNPESIVLSFFPECLTL